VTWRALHKYGEGQLQIVDDGARRPPTPTEARAIARELERFADEGEARDRVAGLREIDTEAPGYLADPDVDAALFAGKTHDVVAVFEAVGGSRLRCLACRLEGQRLYQDGETAQAYARMLSGTRMPAWPRCA
jgi:hypothetical protein